MLGGGQRTSFPANDKGMASEAAGKRSEGCSRELCEAKMASGDRPSPCHFRLAARPGCLPTVFTAGGAAREPMASAKP
eukprot:3068139-Prymnesium_polylepis.1